MFKKILVPLDVTLPDDSARLLEAAKKLNADWQGELHVATVIPDVGMAIVGSYFDETFETASRSAAETELANMVSNAGVQAHQHVLMGRIYEAVLGEAERLDVDLILLGAHQPELSDYLLGSNAARIVRHTKRSVLVLRDDV